MTIFLPKISGFIVKKSTFLEHGLGVITNRSYKKGGLLFTVEGPIKSKGSKYSFAIGLNQHIEPERKKNMYNLGHYVNHSCDPNAIIQIVEKNVDTPYIKVIARRNIKTGEEITFDYASLEYEVTVNNSLCQCNTKECRRIIHGFKGLPTEVIKKYKKEGIIADYLLKIN